MGWFGSGNGTSGCRIASGRWTNSVNGRAIRRKSIASGPAGAKECKISRHATAWLCRVPCGIVGPFVPSAKVTGRAVGARGHLCCRRRCADASSRIGRSDDDDDRGATSWTMTGRGPFDGPLDINPLVKVVNTLQPRKIAGRFHGSGLVSIGRVNVFSPDQMCGTIERLHAIHIVGIVEPLCRRSPRIPVPLDSALSRQLRRLQGLG